MAEIRCSNCGKDNPDFLDVCQFCQSPLRPDPLLHIGEEPTKKNTDELEEILPDWLKEARQQGKNEEAVDDAFRSQSRPKVSKDEPLDLLAGLMSQADSDEEEVPDWLADIAPSPEKESPKPSPSDKEQPSDFFAQFKEPEPQPAPESEPAQEMPARMGEQKDELTDWFSQTSAEPAPFGLDEAGGNATGDDDWMKSPGPFDASVPETPAEKEPEDLSWLRDLEAESKGTSELREPQKDSGFDFASTSSTEDLGWLDNLGGISTPSLEEPVPSQPASSADDLDWLNKLGAASEPAFEEPVSSQPASSEEDLGWLNKLAAASAPVFEEPAPLQPASSEEDLDWLNKLGAASAPAFDEPIPSQPASAGDDLGWLSELGRTTESPIEEPVQPQQSTSQDDLSWLNELGGTSQPSEPAAQAFADTGELYSGQEPPASSKPFQTAPLKDLIGDEEIRDTTPDWLKSALEEPTMPAPGAVSMDWFSEHDKTADTSGGPTQGEPASSQPAFDLPLGDSSASSAQDVDSLFNMEMPDWLSSEMESAEAPPQAEESTPQPAFIEEGEALAPVELPSWVQAMRPVDSAISETPASADQITEREGPLAGFRGVIPAAAIGSSLRPKPVSMMLQVTEEQQAGASLLEQIIATETIKQPVKPAEIVSSQRMLRWVLAVLFLVVLGIVLGLGLRTMPIPASAAANELSGIVAGIPEGEAVLVVIDYEPSFAGELEVSAGPLLDGLALSRRSTFTFVSMSPNGSALVDRLMSNTKISQPAPDGLGYQAGVQYFNLGFLPGGSAGVLGFIQDPAGGFAKYAAVILMTDTAETGRVWVEQLEAASPEVAGKPLLLVSSAQSGPMLQPYVSSGQVDIMINGLYDAAKYELVNVSRPGTARVYWDAFGYGLMLAVIAIVLGSLWSVYMRFRERRAEAEQG